MMDCSWKSGWRFVLRRVVITHVRKRQPSGRAGIYPEAVKSFSSLFRPDLTIMTTFPLLGDSGLVATYNEARAVTFSRAA